jgi:hypothetical protein
MSNIKDKLADAGHAAVDAAKNAGYMAVGAAAAVADFVKDKAGLGKPAEAVNPAAVKEHMDVIASCGTKVGVVDHLEGQTVKLTQRDSPDGLHHFIPLSWVKSVNDKIHLTKNSVEAKAEWKPTAAACGC